MNTLTAPLSTDGLAHRVAVGTLDRIPAWQVDNGDIITCPDRCCAQLVMGCSTEITTRLLLVEEDQTWEDRHAWHVDPEMLVLVVHPHGLRMVDFDHGLALAEDLDREIEAGARWVLSLEKAADLDNARREVATDEGNPHPAAVDTRP